MTRLAGLPVGWTARFDAASTVALAACRAALVPVSIVAVLALRTRVRRRSAPVSGHPEPRTV